MISMKMVSIATARDEHRRYCGQPEGGWLGDMKPSGDHRNWGWPGDVRRCVHGKVMIGYEVMGTVPAYWRDLSPVWNPILYRRARNALGF